MHVEATKLKPLASVALSKDETAMVKWIRSVDWQKIPDAREALFKAKLPEFYGGLRMYRMQAGGAVATGAGSLGGMEVFIKKLAFHGVLTKKDLYPVEGHGNQPRFLTLTQADLDNLGVGKDEDDNE